MKLTELAKAKAEGMILAFAPYDGADTDHAYPVKVINERAERQVYGRARYDSFKGHRAAGVTVEHVAADGAPVARTQEDGSPRRETVAQQKIIGTWAEYTERKATRHAAQARRQQRQTMSKEAAGEAAAKLRARLEAEGREIAYNAVEVVGIGGYSNGRHYQPHYAYGVRVAPEILGWLMEG
jgi:hypothetical protein